MQIMASAAALGGWVSAPMAIDILRATRIERLGYRVRTQTIPAAITPRNRLLLGELRESAAGGGGPRHDVSETTVFV